MRKLIRPYDYLLLTLGVLGDVFEEIRDPFGWQAHYYKYIYGWVPERFTRHNFERAVRRMLKTKDIERLVKKGKPILRLSSQGKEKWVREFPLRQLSQKPWDGFWTVVSFDIPEKLKGRRGSLRLKLQSLGMARLQESLYLTPFDFGQDLQEFISVHDLSEFVDVFKARHIFGSNPKELAWRVWQLEKLEISYNEFLSSLNLNSKNKKLMKPEERTKYQVHFEEILLDDPLLPKELLPRDWVGFNARKLILGW